jgi:hypothetical protein
MHRQSSPSSSGHHAGKSLDPMASRRHFASFRLYEAVSMLHGQLCDLEDGEGSRIDEPDHASPDILNAFVSLGRRPHCLMLARSLERDSMVVVELMLCNTTPA